MPLGSFTLFTTLGAGIWTVILALVGFALGRTAGNISYLELCERGKAMVSANVPWVVGGALLLVLGYALVSKAVMGRTKKNRDGRL